MLTFALHRYPVGNDAVVVWFYIFIGLCSVHVSAQQLAIGIEMNCSSQKP